MRSDLTQVHIVLGNYDFEMGSKQANSIDKVSADGQARVGFALRGEKGDDFDNPVQPGEYTGKKLGWVDIYHYADGGQQVVNIKRGDGKVTITEVTDTEIKGSIEVVSEGKVVKASFTAKKVKA